MLTVIQAEDALRRLYINIYIILAFSYIQTHHMWFNLCLIEDLNSKCVQTCIRYCVLSKMITVFVQFVYETPTTSNIKFIKSFLVMYRAAGKL